MNGPTTKKIHIQTKSILYKKENTNSSDQFTTTIYIYTHVYIYIHHIKENTQRTEPPCLQRRKEEERRKKRK